MLVKETYCNFYESSPQLYSYIALDLRFIVLEDQDVHIDCFVDRSAHISAHIRNTHLSGTFLGHSYVNVGDFPCVTQRYKNFSHL